MAINPKYGKGLKITSGKADYIQKRIIPPVIKEHKDLK